MRVLLPVLGAVVVATLLLATAVWVRGGRVDGSPAASVGPTTPAEPAAPTTGSPVAPSTTGSPVGATTTGSPVAAPTTGRPSSFSRVVQWMNQHGPTGGGATGPGEEAYYLLMRGDCAGALAIAEGELRGLGRTLYGGVASACLAAFERRTELWPRADAAYARTRSEAARFDCETRAVYALLGRLVEAHRAYPSARLVRQPVGRRELICPRFTRITPDHGPAEGGYTVRLEGENLPRVVGVSFLEGVDVERHIRAVSPDGRHVVITIPRATFRHTLDDPVTISPDGARTFTDSAVQFRYDPPAVTTRPSTSTTTTTTTTVPTSTTDPWPPSS